VNAARNCCVVPIGFAHFTELPARINRHNYFCLSTKSNEWKKEQNGAKPPLEFCAQG
jgi:hypothetical protein